MRYSTEKSMQKNANSEKSVGGRSVVLDMWANHSGSQSQESAVTRSQDQE